MFFVEKIFKIFLETFPKTLDICFSRCIIYVSQLGCVENWENDRHISRSFKSVSSAIVPLVDRRRHIHDIVYRRDTCGYDRRQE